MGNPVVQWQIVTRNPDALTRFYASVFDWKVNADNPLGYRRLDTASGRGINGGVWPAPPEANSFVQLFIEVDDVNRYLQKATAAGARIIIPPQKLPEGEEMAILHDPEGIPFGLVKPARQSSHSG